jgi:hypothetical protein
MLDPARGIGVEEIPNSSFQPVDNSGSWFLVDDGQYKGTFIASGDGSVSLQVNRYADDEITGTTVTPEFAVTAGAIVTLEFGQPQDLSLLVVSVDDDADGQPDRQIAFLAPVSDAAANDAIAPTATVTATRFTGSDHVLHARVVVNAADAGGAGVGDIAYTTTTGVHGSYSQPLSLEAAGDIMVTATDRAGNVQAKPVWATLDDRTGLPFLVSAFAQSRLVGAGLIDYVDDVDFWGIDVSTPGRLEAIAVGVDQRVAVTTTDGTVIAGSTTGHGVVKASAVVQPGKYLVRVTGLGASVGSAFARRPYGLTASLRSR